MTKLPEIKETELVKRKQEKDGWDFLFLFTDKYLEMVVKNNEIIQEFNKSQLTLLGYNYLYGEVNNGGFIQLIENGYGGLIFNNQFSETIKSWGAEKIAEIVAEANVIYNKHKEKLDSATAKLKEAKTSKEAEKAMEESSKLYEEITEFEPLEDMFYGVMDQETVKIRKYVEKNANEFALIV